MAAATLRVNDTTRFTFKGETPLSNPKAGKKAPPRQSLACPCPHRTPTQMQHCPQTWAGTKFPQSPAWFAAGIQKDGGYSWGQETSLRPENTYGAAGDLGRCSPPGSKQEEQEEQEGECINHRDLRCSDRPAPPQGGPVPGGGRAFSRTLGSRPQVEGTGHGVYRPGPGRDQNKGATWPGTSCHCWSPCRT